MSDSIERQVWHTIVALEPEDVEMVRKVGLAAAGLFVESCDNCSIQEDGIVIEAQLPTWWIHRCEHHRTMAAGMMAAWHLVGSRVVEVGESVKEGAGE